VATSDDGEALGGDVLRLPGQPLVGEKVEEAVGVRFPGPGRLGGDDSDNTDELLKLRSW
jgi:hypothetical protein